MGHPNFKFLPTGLSHPASQPKAAAKACTVRRQWCTAPRRTAVCKRRVQIRRVSPFCAVIVRHPYISISGGGHSFKASPLFFWLNILMPRLFRSMWIRNSEYFYDALCGWPLSFLTYAPYTYSLYIIHLHLLIYGSTITYKQCYLYIRNYIHKYRQTETDLLLTFTGNFLEYHA